jgi:hypothetical protein
LNPRGERRRKPRQGAQRVPDPVRTGPVTGGPVFPASTRHTAGMQPPDRDGRPAESDYDPASPTIAHPADVRSHDLQVTITDSQERAGGSQMYSQVGAYGRG